MGEYFASGNWQVTKGKENEFVDRWTEFLQWTRETQPELVSVRLVRRTEDPSHFVSFADWESAAARTSWKETSGFQDHLMACRSLCDQFDGGDYDRVVEL
jgi:heme-degrading monooxygenase HmoA